jgi:hypothetical protein
LFFVKNNLKASEREMLNQTNQTENKLAPNQFVENEIVFEKVTINLPVSVVDYYRAMAHFQDTTELTLIENDLVEKLEADFEGRKGPDWKQMFNLYPALEALKK